MNAMCFSLRLHVNRFRSAACDLIQDLIEDLIEDLILPGGRCGGGGVEMQACPQLTAGQCGSQQQQQQLLLLLLLQEQQQPMDRGQEQLCALPQG